MVKYTSQKQVKLDSNRGRFSVDVRTVLAAMIVKHFLKLDDRGIIH